ncbi:MAG: ATP-grasp domain-containing protein [Bacteroidetes bacterium]|nr:ATP-grasp domain-containing protein [Bacteroidota bacterium]
MNILITSAGQRVSLVNAFQKELKELQPNAKVFTTDLNPKLSPACQIADRYFKVLPVTHENYISELLSICLTNSVKLIIPTIDTELQTLADHKDQFAAKGVDIIVSEPDLIKKCRDKRLTNDLFKDKLIDIPVQYTVDNYQFPLFFKPVDGSLSKGIGIARVKDDLSNYDIHNDRIMLMEYVDPSVYSEYTVDAYFDKSSELKCLVPRKRLQVRAGEVSKALTQRNQVYDELVEKFACLKGAKGCLTIQVFFAESDNSLLGIEINPRFGGGYPLSYMAGANYPKYLLQEYLLEQSIPFNEDWDNNLLMLRYDAEVLVNDYEE